MATFFCRGETVRVKRIEPRLEKTEGGWVRNEALEIALRHNRVNQRGRVWCVYDNINSSWTAPMIGVVFPDGELEFFRLSELDKF